jgi:hypothetical protein
LLSERKTEKQKMEAPPSPSEEEARRERELFVRMKAQLGLFARAVESKDSRALILQDLKNAGEVSGIGLGIEAFRISLGTAKTVRIKIVDLNVAPTSDVQGMAEAFLWVFLGRDYSGPAIPPREGRSGRQLSAFSDWTVLNVASFRAAAIFQGEDAHDLYSTLEIASSDEMKPAVATERERIGTSLSSGEIPRFMVIEVSDTSQEAYGKLLSGLNPVETVDALLVQMLSTLRALNDAVGFVHGSIDLSKIAVSEMAGRHRLIYNTPDPNVRLSLGSSAAGSLVRFHFVDFPRATLGADEIDALLRVGSESARKRRELEWAIKWEDRLGRSGISHALDLHALGIAVLETIAWRISEIDDPTPIKDRLWKAAEFCLDALMLRPKDFLRAPVLIRAFGKPYEIDARRLYEVFRQPLKLALKQSRSAVGDDEHLAKYVFATYSELVFRVAGAEEEEYTAAAELTSDPTGVADNDVMSDLTFFTKSAHFRDFKGSARRRLDYWKHPYMARFATKAQ